MDVDGSSSSVNLNSELKTLEGKHKRELEEAMNEESRLRKTVEAKEDEVRQWTKFITHQRQTIQELEDKAEGLMEKIGDLQEAVGEYEENEEEEKEGGGGRAEGGSEDDEMREGNEIGKCVECRVKRASIALVPCMHLCFCHQCHERIEFEGMLLACPICSTVSTTIAIIRLP